MKKALKKVLSAMLVAIMLLSAAPLSGIDLGIAAKAAADELAESGKCGNDATYTFDEATGTLTISGTGYVYSYSFDSDKIKSVIIGDGITEIGNYAFDGCNNLTSVTIGSGLTKIPGSMFEDCQNLTSIKISENNPVYDSRDNCNAIIETATNTLVFGCGNSIIPNGVAIIGDGAFENCNNLTNITIPDSVTYIGQEAFQDCSSLTNIIIPDSVTVIGESAFEKCTDLTSITISNGITTISGSMFSNCTSLKSIDIPDSVTNIDYCAFIGCTSLESISLSKKLTTIGAGAFQRCGFTDINIPGSVDTIYPYAFYCCTNLESLTISEGVKAIGMLVFQGCSSLTDVTLPKSLKAIETGAFAQCTNLTEIEIPEGVTTIMNEVFYECEKLEKVTIPDSVTVIDDGVFCYCKNLKNITLPDSIIYMGDIAFGASGLESITLPNNSSLTTGYGVFAECENLTQITIPESVPSIGYGMFAESGYWNNEANWEDGALYVDNCLLGAQKILSDSYAVRDGTRIIAGGAFVDCEGLTDINIPDSVTSIGEDVFSDTAYFNDDANWDNDVLYIGNHLIAAKPTLSGEYKIKDGTKSIAAGAFVNSELTKIDIPDGITNIGEYTFESSHLTEINIPDSVTVIGNYAFAGSAFENITIPNSVTNMGCYAFNGCENLTSVKLSDNLTSISNYMFLSCENLTEITLPDSIERIGSYSFGYCDSLKEITIPENVTSIGYLAFGICENLKTITFPRHIQAINETALAYCTSLTDIYFAGSPSEWKTAYLGKYTGTGSGGTDESTLILHAAIHYGRFETSTGEFQFDFDSDTFDIEDNNSIEFVVKSIDTESEEVGDFVTSLVGNDLRTIYNITCINNSQKLQPQGGKVVTVRLPIPAGISETDKVFIAHRLDNGKIERIRMDDGNVWFENGMLCFKTSSFSMFAVCVEDDEEQTTPVVQSVSLDNLTMNYKYSTTLKPVITADEGAEYTITYSSDSKNVTVDENGKIYAAKRGTANITVSVTDSQGNTVTDTCKVEVKYTWWQWLIKIVLFGWIWY